MTAFHGDAVGAVEAPAAEPSTADPSLGEADTTEPAPGIPWWSAFAQSRTWTDAILPTIVLRIVLLAFGVLALVIFRGDALTGSWLAIWNRWDGPHFIEVAQYGYGPPADPARIAILPVYPFMIRALLPFADPVVASMLIAFVATLAAAAGLYRLVRLDHGRATARSAVIAMSIFPTAYALVAPYSEAPYLAFAVWGFVSARQGDWRRTGILSFLAAATRLQGVLVVPALAVEYWVTRRRIGRDAAWLLLGLGGPLLYLAINYVTFLDPFYFLKIQKELFTHESAAPWVVVAAMIRGVAAYEATESWLMVYLAPFVATLVLAVTTLYFLLGNGRRASYFVYAALSLVSFTTVTWPISLPRYLLAVFPMFIVVGRLGTRAWLRPPLFVASTLLLGACLTLFVMGHWAF
jgi:hypothetical protein